MAKISSSKTRVSILTEKEIRDIQSKISELFTEEVDGQIGMDIVSLKAEISSIINRMKFIEVYSSHSGKYKGSRISRMGRKKRELLAEAYLIIFKVREYLLNEAIDYRYYYNTDDGEAGVISFKEEEILKYIKFGQFGLQILDSALKKQGKNTEYQSLLDLHYTNLMNGLQKSASGGFYLVHSAIMNKYGIMNPGLRKKNNQPQVFTRGHIFEAMDIAFSEALQNNAISDFGAIEQAVFGKYLSYDSIAATKGGDNPLTMTQIKANAADVLDYTTIIKDLNEILNLLNLKSKEEIRMSIEKIFMDKDKYQSLEAFNNAANNAVDKLLDDLIK